MARILVAYATKTGTTEEIARAVAKSLKIAGHEPDLAGAGSVATLDGYDAVVIGGPMYFGRIEGQVAKFVRRHSGALARLPVAGFIVGLAPVSGDPAQIAGAEKVLAAALAPVAPVSVAVFAGRLDPEKLSWFQRWVTKKVKSPVGDFRDWSGIAAWARELPAKMGL